MKKILIIMIMVVTVPAYALDMSDLIGGGDGDNSAVGAGLKSGDNDTGSNFDNSGTGSDEYDWQTPFSVVEPGLKFNNSGTGSNFDNSGTGSDFNNVDSDEYDDQDPVGKSPFGGSSERNPFSSEDNGVPKLSLMSIVGWLVDIMNQLVYLIIGASLVSFLYGILKLSFIDGHKPEAREQARKFMFWGIVSLFVMMSVWGLVNILNVTLFNNKPLIIPQLK